MRPILGIALGDTHVLSDTGLVIPGYKIASKEGRAYQASNAQKFLYTSFKDFCAQAKARARGHRVLFMFGGDGGDGVNHHGTTQTTGIDDDQISMAVELLMPLVNMADECLGVTGTAAHVGDMGDVDRTICRELGIPVAGVWKTNVGQRRLWLAHHGLPVGRMNGKEHRPAITAVDDWMIGCSLRGERRPDAIIAHDKHKSFTPFEVSGVRVAVCPCWQLPTYYGTSRWPFESTSIGGLFWDVTSNNIDRITYDAPQAIKTVFDAD